MENQKELQSPWGLNFFGLTYNNSPQIRVGLFTQIHEIVFHGKGGYDWHTVYNMPTWLRNFTFKKIQEFYDEEKKSYEKSTSTSSSNKTVIDQDGKIKSPEFLKNNKHNRKPVNYK
jgi:hypothetical protein